MRKARARFFEQNKQQFRGGLASEEMGVVREGNEVVHHVEPHKVSLGSA